MKFLYMFRSQKNINYTKTLQKYLKKKSILFFLISLLIFHQFGNSYSFSFKEINNNSSGEISQNELYFSNTFPITFSAFLIEGNSSFNKISSNQNYNYEKVNNFVSNISIETENLILFSYIETENILLNNNNFNSLYSPRSPPFIS